MKRPGSAARTIIITGSDGGYFPLLQDAVCSITDLPQSRDVHIGVLDFGLDAAQREWLADLDVVVVEPDYPTGTPAALAMPKNLGYLTRPYLRDYFSGYERYLWLDADAWLQGWDAVVDLERGADQSGLAIAHERERSYDFQAWLVAWNTKHYLRGYGMRDGLRLAANRNRVNNGVFCLTADAPHWALWQDAMADAVRRSGSAIPHDQFSLNRLLLLEGLPAKILDPSHNWICGRGLPMWDDARNLFCVPRPDYRALSVVHLAGARAKSGTFDIRTTGGGVLTTGLRYSGRKPPPASADFDRS